MSPVGGLACVTRLVIMRHAHAAVGSTSDFERPLTQIGQAQARQAGVWLTRLDVQPTHAIVSSARRTIQTHEHLAGAWTWQPRDDCYNASLAILCQVVRSTPPTECLLLVAHNPGVTDLAMACGHTTALLPGQAVVVEWSGPLTDFLVSPPHPLATFEPVL